ncbi:hypothetical protein DBB_8280 [Desulfoluna spongiiphila]|nr:hypothetical protein DBB_8280 [Desulfoluna spongiiphila]
MWSAALRCGALELTVRSNPATIHFFHSPANPSPIVRLLKFLFYSYLCVISKFRIAVKDVCRQRLDGQCFFLLIKLLKR